MSTDKPKGERTFISAHCIVRYFERHYGIDIEEVKRHILPDFAKKLITIGHEKYVIGDMEFRINNNVVITCVKVEPDQPLKKAKNRPKKHKSNKKRKKEPWQVEKQYSKKNKKGGYR